MTFETGLGARLGISGTLECKDKDGKVLSVIELSGSIPLSELGLSIDQAETLIASQPQPETTNGPDHRE